jgi:DNA invertase Pin-like site-specific DNA recombinase
MHERTKPKAIRCAIYTRKSTDEGLEQDFNSLHAQREACEAFIASQRHEGWKLIATAYDDGGFSGGRMDRPALQKLLNDVHANKIDAVVVYKVDRLTRSLTDFAKIVDVFDAQDVSFVSVTQAFNTTTSMGRLTLNVLLSFAQFEREVTGERIRDKIAASKKKGLWMGGCVPTGYQAKDRTLVIIQAEASIVRKIFRLYLQYGTVKSVQSELARLKIVRPAGKAKTGRSYGGRPFSRGQIYRLLSNPIYLGEIDHKGTRYDGRHKAIISRARWDAVQAKLTINTYARRVRSNAKDPSLLAGLLYDEHDNRAEPTHAGKQGKRYRYYRLQSRGGTSTHHRNLRPWIIAAGEIEAVVIARLHAALLDRRWLTENLSFDTTTSNTIGVILENAGTLAKKLTSISISEQRSILLCLLKRVTIAASELRIEIRTNELMMALSSSENAQGVQFGPRQIGNKAARAAKGPPDEGVVTLSSPVVFKRRGVETKIILEGALSLKRSQPDPALIKTIARAHVWFEDIVAGRLTMTELATREGMKVSSVAKLLPLAFLAPDIVEAILAGDQSATIVARHLIRSDLPVVWKQQRAEILA